MNTSKNPMVRNQIKLCEKLIPLEKLFNGKEIREAAKALENFRLHFNEQEILYGAKLTIRVDSYNSDFYLVANRIETDKEYQDRLEKVRLAKELADQRALKRKETERLRSIRREADREKLALEQIQQIARANGITIEQLQALSEIK